MKKIIIRAAVLGAALVLLPIHARAQTLLIPGGQVVGLHIGDDSVTVAAYDDALGAAARQAGLLVGDELVSIDGIPIDSAEDVRRALERSDGDVAVQVDRAGTARTLTVEPAITRQGPKLGVYLRCGVTGIGTVTYCHPDTGEFGTLGHGVSGSDGTPVDMVSGEVYGAAVMTVKKGAEGAPGQLRGAMEPERPLGTLTANTARGVFGRLTGTWPGQPLPLAAAEQVHPGSAVIRSTVRGDAVEEYSVEIVKIYAHSRPDGRNLLLRVTDPDLLAATGGIVQGMSGSPIIQDGKLVGAVTHVLVNDPTRGYGIFIENMLDAAG